MVRFSLARELGYRVSEVLQWPAIEVNYWLAYFSLQEKDAEQVRRQHMLRRLVADNLKNIKGRFRSGNNRSIAR